ncbi:hypothetical protein Bpfe_003605 [Biomphalaria pfeifferi]|uniref:Uncharacterized protein n=1 Tax=Biomphalaria pfeifferi TaxID=112525 RepID=A0AAD8C7I6_BIOPF|nr:hypothetical protein Bpfe_003605 [Biomphalaria pfeifferi]
MNFKCITTVFMTLYLASCNDDTETWRFTLNSSENNSPTCGKYFIHDVDHFTIKGSLNISEIIPYFILSEIVNPTGGRIQLNCTIKFKNITHPSNKFRYCLCEQENNDTNLYHFTYKFLMKKNYSLSTFQANLTFINASSPDSRPKTIRVQEKIPEVIEIASTDHDIELKVNDDLIDDITNCSKRVNSSNVKIGYSSMEGKRFVKEMKIIYNNKTYMIPNGKEEAIDLNMLDSKKYNVTLELINCANFTKQINCMFILEIYRHSENEVHNSTELFPVKAVALRKWRKRKSKEQQRVQSLTEISIQANTNSAPDYGNETNSTDTSLLPHSTVTIDEQFPLLNQSYNLAETNSINTNSIATLHYGDGTNSTDNDFYIDMFTNEDEMTSDKSKKEENKDVPDKVTIDEQFPLLNQSYNLAETNSINTNSIATLHYGDGTNSTDNDFYIDMFTNEDEMTSDKQNQKVLLIHHNRSQI